MSIPAQPLVFMSGKFQPRQVRWHISQRELYPIIHAFFRFDFLLKNPSRIVNIVTDHAALKYIIDPSIAKNKAHTARLTRWALTIQEVTTRIFHNPGRLHHFADLLTRWGYSSTAYDSHTTPKRDTATDEPKYNACREVSGSSVAVTQQDTFYDNALCHKFQEALYYQNDQQSIQVNSVNSMVDEVSSISEDRTLSIPKAQIETAKHLDVQHEDILQHMYDDLFDPESQSSVSLDEQITTIVDEAIVWIQEFERGFCLSTNFCLSNNFIEDNNDHKPPDIEPVPNIADADIKVDRATRLQQRQKLEHFSRTLGDAFRYDDISFFNPYYEGPHFLLDYTTLRDIQIKDGLLTPTDDDLYKDDDGRIHVKEKRLPHLIVAIHVQNHHVGLAMDLQVLSQFSVEGKTRAELTEIMRNYRTLCLHCARYPYMVRMPFNKTLIGRRPRAVLRMDYLTVNKSGNILVILDTFSRKTFLKYAKHEDAETAAKGILEWNAHYGLAANFILLTDNGAHFANKLMARLIPLLRGKHEFTVPFAPWTNGSCENRNRSVLRILRQLCSELTLNSTEWPNCLSTVMTVINNLPIPSRKGHSANELFLHFENPPTMIPKTRLQLDSLLLDVNEDLRDLIQQFHEELIKFHEHDSIYREIDLARDLQNKRRNKDMTVIQFRPGDWVLYSSTSRPNRINKLQPIWVGPFRVTEVVGKNVYQIQDIFGKKMQVHASRLWFYNTSEYVPNDYVQKMYRQHWTGLELDGIHDITQDTRGNIQVAVKWYGFPMDEPEILPLENVLDGAHLLLDQFLEANKDSIRPELLQEVKRQIRDRLLQLENADAVSIDSTQDPTRKSAEHNDSLNISSNSLDLSDDTTQSLSAEAITFTKPNSDEIAILYNEPTYLPGWTSQEVRQLQRLLKTVPVDLTKYTFYFPAKKRVHINNKIKRLLNLSVIPTNKTFSEKWPHLHIDEPLTATFDRDLRNSKPYQKCKQAVELFLQRNREGLIAAIQANRDTFRQLSMTEIYPNYWRFPTFVYRHVPEDVLFRCEKVENTEWVNEEEIDLLYVDPPYSIISKKSSEMDYGRHSIYELGQVLRKFPTKLLALWTVGYVIPQVYQLLDSHNFEIMAQVDWIKMTTNGNVVKTKGFYLKHSKETLIIARQVDSLGISDIAPRKLPQFFFAPQTISQGKPREAQQLLEKWFPECTSRLELYARNHNLRSGWKAIGTELQFDGLEALIISRYDLEPKFCPNKKYASGTTDGKEGVT